MRTSRVPMSHDETPGDSAAGAPSTDVPSPESSSMPYGTRTEPVRDSDQYMQNLEELRKKMKVKMASQQSQFKQSFEGVPSPGQDMTTHYRNALRDMRSHPGTPLRQPNSPGPMKHPAGIPHRRASSQDLDASYPFPRGSSEHASRLRDDPRLLSQRSSRGALKKKLGKQPETCPMPERPVPPVPRSAFMPCDASPAPEDPLYPSPSLYELTLNLSADPGLDGWWSNVCQMLRTHYGAERASLSVPGDVTDLENVPWGQKATYGRYARDHRRSSARHSPASSSESLPQETGTAQEPSPDIPSGENTLRRPKLFSRHSFAGYGTPRNESGPQDQGPRIAELKKNATPRRTSLSGSSSKPQEILEKSKAKAGHSSSSAVTQSSCESDLSGDASQFHVADPLARVFQVPCALDVEPNPLIKRAGIPRLFGRTKPVVLTREYADDPMVPQGSASIHRHKDIIQPTPREEVPGKPACQGPSSARRAAQNRAGKGKSPLSVLGEESESDNVPPEKYEDYEQVPQSPWSQSPAPSPAPLAKPDENPFFVNPEVDETTFTASPPFYDYSEHQLLRAIGVDWSKTVIHIPLLFSPLSRGLGPETLRFPVAIISFLAPIIPYPSNLRVSLAWLMPHLTQSFSLAQKYSRLEKQLMSSSMGKYGQLLGLGGTFSDEGSELELVTGLGSFPSGEESGSVGRSSISSPVAATRSISTVSVPGLDSPNTAPRKDAPPSAPLSHPGAETSDGYFKSKRPARHPSQLSSQSTHDPVPIPMSTSPLGSDDQETAEYEDITPKDASSLPDVSPVSSRVPASRSSSTSIATQMHRDFLSRPFSDTISQLILNSVPLHLFLAKSPTGEVVWANTKYDAYRRHPQESRIRDPFHNVHASEYDTVIREWTNALRTGCQFTERVRVKRLNDDTTYRWFIFRANPLISPNGELLYWIGSFLDVHEQHMAELKAAQEREVFAINAKYRALANSIPQIVFEAAEFQGLISANEQWEQYTGQSLEDAKHLGFAKYIHRDDLLKCGILTPPQVIPESFSGTEFGQIMGDLSEDTSDELPKSEEEEEPRELSEAEIALELGSEPDPEATPSPLEPSKFSDGVTEALLDLVRRKVVTMQRDENGRDSYTTEIRFRSRRGDFRWHLVRLVKVETTGFGNGKSSWYGTCTDINDRKILEKQLNLAVAQLNQEMESKSKFFTNMSHEIRTPLNGILGTIPFILDTQLDNDQRRMLDTIQNSSTNLRELVDNILDVSRVEAGKMTIIRQWFHVRTILEDSIDTIASRAIDKGLEISYIFDPDVPPMICGDKFRIRQVLINLIGNAVKFTSQGEIFIRCSMLQDHEFPLQGTEFMLNFDVIDTGKGFSTQDAEQLMQRFSQIDSTSNDTSQNSGSGLGLFLSKQIAVKHGGGLKPTSLEGQGAKFSFFIKVGLTPDPDPSEGKSDAAASAENKAQGDGKAPEGEQAQPADESAPEGEKTQNDEKPRENSPTINEPISDATSESIANSQLPSTAVSDISPESTNSGSYLSVYSNSNSSNTGNTDCSTTKSFSTAQSERSAMLSSQTSLVSEPTPVQEELDSTSKASPTSSETVEVSASPVTYSVLIICSYDYSIEAIKQHIEQVIPFDVPANVTCFQDLEDWKELRTKGGNPNFTHLVLNLPVVDDVKMVMRTVLAPGTPHPPIVVVAADAYSKRPLTEFTEDFDKKRIFIVPKPLKPSSFSEIFDPSCLRELSKDRNKAVARAMNDSFKTMSKLVREVLGNKGHRILLVEDDDTNRAVMLKYLDKVKLVSEIARNGQECLDMVLTKEPGYYSLIICDIQMPIKNGYETCEEIRAWEAKNKFPPIPMMALSANAMTDQIANATRAGFNNYVTKPIKHIELGKMMMKLLEPEATRILFEETNS